MAERPNRKQSRDAMRAERLERERAEAAAGRRRRLVLTVVAGVLAVAAVIAIALIVLRGGDDTDAVAEAEVPAQRETNLARAVEAAGCAVRRYRTEGEEHVEGRVAYRSKPPHSGDHSLIPAEDGVYEQAPARENLVHALEHGRIVMQYRPDASREVRGGLRRLFDEDPVHMVLTPDSSGMTFEVAATSWYAADPEQPNRSRGQVLGCPRMNPRVYDAIRTFRDAYRDRSPEYVP